MAKGNLFMGMARGKVGSVVFSRLDGKQITRAHNSEVKNPRTYAQAMQRAIFATVTKTAASLAPIVESSFDGKKDGQESRNEFVRVNTELLRQQVLAGSKLVHLMSKGSVLPAPNPLIVSRGPLGSFTIDVNDLGQAYILSAAYLEADSITLGDFAKKNPNIKAGSQLTFVLCTSIVDVPEEMKWKYARFVIGNWADESTPIILKEPLTGGGNRYYINKAAIDDSKTEGFIEKEGQYYVDNFEQVFNVASDDNGWRLEFAALSTDDVMAWSCGIIVSNYNANTQNWEHSECKLTSVDMGILWPKTNEEVIPTYMNAASTKSSDYYTQQSTGEETVIFYNTFNEAIQAFMKVNGYQDKTLSFGTTNSYGPIPEGSTVELFLVPNEQVTIQKGTIKLLIGESTIQARAIRTGSGFVIVVFDVPFGTSNSVTANLSFEVDAPSNFSGERAGLRINISKVQA